MSSVGPDCGAGAIVMAVYEPDPVLFGRQLRSIRDQSLRGWTCILAADSPRAPIEVALRAAVGEDSRFVIVGDGERLGFYRNFERGLRAVPADAKWVALSDQDDQWYPQKLEALVPMLEHSVLVSGQVRLVDHPSGRILGTATRYDVSPSSLVLNNEFTGSASVFRATLLKQALPFPSPCSRTAAHDHWLAVVAAYTGGTTMSPQTLQDYVQHESNVFGDPRRRSRRTPFGLARTIGKWAGEWEGGTNPAAVIRMLFWLFVGWRQLLVDTLQERVESARGDAVLSTAFGEKRRFRRLVGVIIRARRAGLVPTGFVVTYVMSWLAGALVGGRRRVEDERLRPRR